MTVNLETHLPNILAAYLTTQALGITFKAGYNADVIDRPFALIFCDAGEMIHRNIQVCNITVRYQCTSEDAIEPENEKVATIRRALTDWKAMNAYIFSLPDADRLNWDMGRPRITGQSIELEPTNKTRDRITTLTIRARSNETTI